MATGVQVTVPLAIVRDNNGAQHYFYEGSILPGGLDEDHVQMLLDEEMAAEVDLPDDVDAGEESDKIADILDRVGDDKDAAAVALAKEQEKGDDARPSLVSKLMKVIEG